MIGWLAKSLAVISTVPQEATQSQKTVEDGWATAKYFQSCAITSQNPETDENLWHRKLSCISRISRLGLGMHIKLLNERALDWGHGATKELEPMYYAWAKAGLGTWAYPSLLVCYVVRHHWLEYHQRRPSELNMLPCSYLVWKCLNQWIISTNLVSGICYNVTI